MSRSLYEPNAIREIGKNRFGVKGQKQKPGAMRWWEPGCTPGNSGCTGEEPPLENSWAQPAAPLEPFAFRLHADGSLEFKGHLDSAAATSATVAVTLPGAIPGEVDFLPANDQFFLSVIYDGATPQPAMIKINATTGAVTITFPV